MWPDVRVFQTLVEENNGRYFTNDMVKECGQVVQSIVVQRQKAGVSSDVARKETRRAVVSGNTDAKFLDALKSISKKYIVPALKAIGSFVVEMASDILLKTRCSLM